MIVASISLSRSHKEGGVILLQKDEVSHIEGDVMIASAIRRYGDTKWAPSAHSSYGNGSNDALSI